MIHLTPTAAALTACGIRADWRVRRGLFASPSVVYQYLRVHGTPLVSPTVLGMQCEYLTKMYKCHPTYEESSRVDPGMLKRLRNACDAASDLPPTAELTNE